MNLPDVLNPTTRRGARTVVIGLGAARVIEGAVEVLATRSFLRALGSRDAEVTGAVTGFRMKGGRDVALGVMALAGWQDDRLLAVAAGTAVLVDGVDGLSVLADGGQNFPAWFCRLGGAAGILTAGAAAVAAVALHRPQPSA